VLVDKPIWKQSTPEQKAILVTILCMVNHDTEEWEWNGKKYLCRPGQKITSLQSIAQEAGKGISIKNVRTAIERFEKLEFLANESTKQNRLITVLNWGLYQSAEENRQSNRQTGGKGVATNKNVRMKEDKKNKEYINIGTQLETAIDDFKEFRKKIKKPMTDRAVELLIDKLNKLASDDVTKIAILNQSIVNGWQGVFPLKQDTPQSKSKSNNLFLQEDI
jgi:DNA replication protein DnaD